MKWIVVSKTSEQELYELWLKDKKVMALEFHPSTNSARISSDEEQRVFHLRKEGLLKNKTVLRNEYGIRIGRLGYEKWDANHGYVELGNEKFNYTIGNNPMAELRISRDNSEEPLVVCGLKVKNDSTPVHFSNQNELSPSEYMLLLSLCWYIVLPVAKENVAEYAL